MISTAQAVASLRPGVEWTMNGDDVANIVWHTEGVEPLTKAMVNAEIKRLEEVELSKVSAKAALLERLGITEDEAKLLLG
jgi:hypothetical protein